MSSRAAITPPGGAKEEHSHARSATRALAIGLGLTLSFAVVEVVAGLTSGSLALVADAGHMLVDTSGLVLALVASIVAQRPSDVKRTFGYMRVEVLVVPVQVMLMLGIAGYIVYEAIQRIGGSHAIDALPVLVVGVIGLGVNVVALRLLHEHHDSNLNAHAASLEVLVDALGSIAVIISAIVLETTGWAGIDVVISLAIGVLVLPRAAALLWRAIGILLEGTPPGVDIRAIEADAKAVRGVIALHDLHVWQLTPAFLSLSAHVELENGRDYERPIAELSAIFGKRHGITHVTLQPETPALHAAIECCDYPDVPAERAREHVHHGG
jgi:cobalt-zinc-cadmium efflux system protein